MRCSWCGNEILPGMRYLYLGQCSSLCEDCVENEMEEYDPEGDYIDMKTDEAIERRLGLDD